jgi:hypothetical protein
MVFLGVERCDIFLPHHEGHHQHSCNKRQVIRRNEGQICLIKFYAAQEPSEMKNPRPWENHQFFG